MVVVPTYRTWLCYGGSFDLRFRQSFDQTGSKMHVCLGKACSKPLFLVHHGCTGVEE